MKSARNIAKFLLAAIGLQLVTGCFGKFALTGKVYKWHDGMMGSDMLGRFVKSVILIPGYIVYSLTLVVDIIVFNLIEFWTGSNPIAMLPGQTETQFVTFRGKSYKITAEKNKMTFTDLASNKVNTLYFDENSSGVSVLKDGQMVKVADYKLETKGFNSVMNF